MGSSNDRWLACIRWLLRRRHAGLGRDVLVGRAGAAVSIRPATIRRAGRDGPSLSQTEKLRKAKAMRQFVKGDGEKGNSEAYREGWERTFGGDSEP